MGNPPIDEVANVLHSNRVLSLNFSDLKKAVENMIDCGHRYKNMEKALNYGICFSLGTALKES